MSEVCNGCPDYKKCGGSIAVDCKIRDIISANNAEWIEETKELVNCLSELIDLMEDDGYKPDSFTTQPARTALKKWQERKKEKGI